MADESTTTEQEVPKTIRVRYDGNVEARNRTAGIKLFERDDIAVGGEGDVTVEEFGRLNAMGLILTPVGSSSSEATSSTKSSRPAASSSSTTPSGDGSAS